MTEREELAALIAKEIPAMSSTGKAMADYLGEHLADAILAAGFRKAGWNTKRVEELEAALRLARERIAGDRQTMNAISAVYQANSDKADLVDAQRIQDQADAELFKIIDGALGPNAAP